MPNQITLEIILEAALEIPDLQERSAYLDEACGGDRTLRDEAGSLIAAHLAAETFMDTAPDPLWREVRSEKEGDTIERYKLLRQIGEGGFGTVYLAEQSEPMKTTGGAQDHQAGNGLQGNHRALRGGTPGAGPDGPPAYRKGA